MPPPLPIEEGKSSQRWEYSRGGLKLLSVSADWFSLRGLFEQSVDLCLESNVFSRIELSPFGPPQAVAEVARNAGLAGFFGLNLGRSTRMYLRPEYLTSELTDLGLSLPPGDWLTLEWDGVQVGERSAWRSNVLLLRFSKNEVSLSVEAEETATERRMAEEVLR